MFNRPEKNGFDICIGNPPYINVENIDVEIKNNISKFTTAYQKFDLYVLFYEVGLFLIRKHGILIFITSNKFLSQGYGMKLRQEFLKNTINKIVNFNYDIFESATVRTCILEVSKKASKKDSVIDFININSIKEKEKFFNKNYSQIYQYVFDTTEENNFRLNLTTEKMAIIHKIDSLSIKLDKICSVNYGLRPSSEKLGLKKEAFIHEHNDNDKLVKYFEGKDMGYWLIDNTHFLDYRPDVMYNAMFPELFANKKLVGIRTLSDITKLRFIYDEEGYYCNDSTVILTLWYLFKNINYQTVKRTITNEKIEISKKYSYPFLQGILNSNITKFYVNELMYDGTHFYPNHMKALPIPIIKSSEEKPINDLVDQILAAKKSDPFADTSALESQIDQLVYKLYNLTNEEIKIVEGK